LDAPPVALEIASPERRPALLAGSLGTFAAILAYTGPLGNLPTVAHALSAGPSGQTWILSSMSVGLAAAVLTVGALADDHGRRRAFVVGCLVLALGSIGCAIAGDIGWFIAGRLVEGLGSAAIVAASLGLIASVSSTPAQRARASGMWGASVGAGIAIGPIATGLLDEVHAWRAFYLLLAIGAVALAVTTTRTVTESRATERRRVDLVGAVTLSGAMVLALIALTEGHSGIDPLVAWAAIGAVVLAIAFVAVERWQTSPMMPLSLFRHRPFSAAMIAALGTGMGVIGVMSFACSFLITSLQLTSLQSGLVLLMWSGTSAVSALLARHVPTALQGSGQLAVGLLGVAAGEFAMVGAVPGSVWRLVPGLVIAGAASGVLNAALGREAVASVPPDRASLGSGANNTARYLGSSIGVTVVVLVATRATGADAAFTGWDHALVLSAVISAVSALLVLVIARKRSAGRAQR
jgi:MFS family permease